METKPPVVYLFLVTRDVDEKKEICVMKIKKFLDKKDTPVIMMCANGKNPLRRHSSVGRAAAL